MAARLIYRSANIGPNLTLETVDILREARARNGALNVTGFLLSWQGGFLQVLEGEAKALSHVFDKIKQDRRHFDIQVLGEWADAPRQFANWSMGCARFDACPPLCAK